MTMRTTTVTDTDSIAAASLWMVGLGILLGWILALFDLPILGTLAGVALAIAIVVDAVPLLIAAAFGGWVDRAETGPPS